MQRMQLYVAHNILAVLPYSFNTQLRSLKCSFTCANCKRVKNMHQPSPSPTPLPPHFTQLLLLFLPCANFRFCLDSESMLSASEKLVVSTEQKECNAAATLFDSATKTIVSACETERQNDSG